MLFTITERILERWLVESYSLWEYIPWKWRNVTQCWLFRFWFFVKKINVIVKIISTTISHGLYTLIDQRFSAQFSKSRPYFRPKNFIFHTRFQTRPLKSILILRPGFYEIMSSLLRLKHGNKKDFLKSISNTHISLSFLLIWNWKK